MADSGIGALKYVKFPRTVTEYSLMKGVTDYSNLKQFDLYETGYSGLVVVSLPTFMTALKDTKIKALQNSVVHIMENEFRGIPNGIPDITSTPGEIENGITSMQLINKVNIDTTVNFDMTFWERGGSLLTKYAEIYLTGINDPYTEAKTYHGLIEDGTLEGSPDNEVFTFLYYVTDNTMRRIEKAVLYVNAQLQTANLSDLYGFGKGDISFKEVTYSFTGFPIMSDRVNKYAAMMLQNDLTTDVASRKLILSSNDYNWDVYNSKIEGDDSRIKEYVTGQTGEALAGVVENMYEGKAQKILSAEETEAGLAKATK